MNCQPRIQLIGIFLTAFMAGCGSIGTVATVTPTPAFQVRTEITPIPLPTRPSPTPTPPPPTPTPTPPPPTPTPTELVFREDVTRSPMETDPGPTEPAATPTARPWPAYLTREGPWLLYCDDDSDAALVNLDGSGRHKPGSDCFQPQHVAGGLGFALDRDDLVQLPTGETIAQIPGEAADIGWSPDERYFASISRGRLGESTRLIVYDLVAARSRNLLSTDGSITAMGWSPSGERLVVSEVTIHLEVFEREGLRGTVISLGPGGSLRRELYDIRSGDFGADFIKGWLSDASFVAARAVEFCDLSLRQANLVTLQTQQIYGIHSHAAVDPVTGTVLLYAPGPGICAGEDSQSGLVRMTASGGWEPQRLITPAAWGTDWGVSRIEWFPGLDQFGVWLGSGAELYPETWKRFVMMNASGEIIFELASELDPDAEVLEVFPSPGGDRLVIAGTGPLGTALYDPQGAMLEELSAEPDVDITWVPGQTAIFIVDARGRLLRASQEENWRLNTVDSRVSDTPRLVWVSRPERPYWPACTGLQRLEYSRLHVGDRVTTSLEPNLPSRLRAEPGLSGSTVGSLNPGDGAVILEGPTCADDFIWWRVRSERTGVVGWTAEGDNAGAWLLPVE